MTGANLGFAIDMKLKMYSKTEYSSKLSGANGHFPESSGVSDVSAPIDQF